MAALQDPLVWPSVFYSNIFREASKLPYGSIEVDAFIDDGKYWLNLEQMKAHYECHKKANAQGVPIAITLFSERSFAGDTISYTLPEGIQCGMTVEHTEPSEVPAGSELLGFDVADASGISGLTNCGYTPEDKGQLQSKWVGRLNDFGLLNTYEDALEFRDVSDKRVEEHAPFWIYSICRLPQISW